MKNLYLSVNVITGLYPLWRELIEKVIDMRILTTFDHALIIICFFYFGSLSKAINGMKIVTYNPSMNIFYSSRRPIVKFLNFFMPPLLLFGPGRLSILKP